MDNPDDNISYYDTLYNLTNSSSSDTPMWYHHRYNYIVPPMLLFCLAPVIVNLRVLISIHWIRRPLSPTVFITLSLAAADTFAPILLATGLIVNSYLPMVLDIHHSTHVTYLIELFRLIGILVTVMHLLALALNHWLGILRPLHYTSMVTTRRLVALVVCLWIMPTVVLSTYFISERCWESPEEIAARSDNVTFFLADIRFRIFFTPLLVGPVVLMCLIYVNILVIVRRHQRSWAKLSRVGSKRNKSTAKLTQQKRNMDGNIKAVYTTLMILGSCIVGWIPAIVVFLLACDHGCTYQPRDFTELKIGIIAMTVNSFVILKSLMNPVIYSTRMIEIIDGTRRMKNALRRTGCCRPCHKARDTGTTSSQQPLCLAAAAANAAGVGGVKMGNSGLHFSIKHHHYQQQQQQQQQLQPIVTSNSNNTNSGQIGLTTLCGVNGSASILNSHQQVTKSLCQKSSQKNTLV